MMEKKLDIHSDGHRKVLVCQGTGCTSSRSEEIRSALEHEVNRTGLSNIEVDSTGCHGFYQLKNDMSLTILATSITLTPGTLSVDVNPETNELYVHWINADPEVLKDMPRDYHPICDSFPDWARRIAG
jgi:ribosomal protein L31